MVCDLLGNLCSGGYHYFLNGPMTIIPLQKCMQSDQFPNHLPFEPGNQACRNDEVCSLSHGHSAAIYSNKLHNSIEATLSLLDDMYK